MADEDAGINRSEMSELRRRSEHLRPSLQAYKQRTVPALDIDAYAETIYRANQALEL